MNVLVVLLLLFMPVAVIAYSCGTVWDVNMCKYRRRKASRRYANFIDSVSIRRWGVFDDVRVNLTGRPVFIAITGETGSGKSNFIAALQYISGLNIYNNKLKHFNSNSSNSDNKEIQIAMSLVSHLHPSSPTIGTSLSNTVKRVYSLTTKKSVCEINDRKVLMKSLSMYLSSCIRFWSTSSIRKLDTNEFIYYVDLNLGQRSVQLLSDIAVVFDDWSQSHRELLYLKDMQLRIVENDELRLVEQQLGELSALQQRTGLLVAALRDFFDRDQDQHAAVSGANRAAAYLEIVELLESSTAGVAKDDLDMTLAWQAIMLSEVFLKRLTKSLSDWMSSSAEPLKKGGGSLPSGRAMEGSGSDHLHSKALGSGYTVLLTMAEQLDDYSNVVLKLKRSLTSIGILNNDILIDIEGLYSSVQTSMDSLHVASQISVRISRQLPDLSSLLEQLLRLRGEWELLARKHSRKPSELQSLKNMWRNEISVMNNLSVALPTQQSIESELRRQYVSMALQLSVYRYQSAQSIISKVNSLLPKLEMPDKKISIKFDSAVTAEHLASAVDALDRGEGSFISKGELQSITAVYVDVVPGGRLGQSGWDSMHLTVDDSVDDDTPDITSAGRSYSSGIIYQQYWDPSVTNDVFTSPDDISEGTMVAPPSSSGISNELSSGECARLALALETISCGDRDERPSSEYDYGQRPTENEASLPHSMESCLVFDEIDAHIGGEAAVSVAKLLKQQGRSRQIIAVTHNPVIAAAADLHIAVVKQQVTSRTHPIAGASASSTISTLSGRSERESELARMATGSLNTTAGVDLARALLDIDFNSL